MFMYDTGICPRCGSKWTGRVVEKRSDSCSFGLMGPILYTSDTRDYGYGCVECGVMWDVPPKMKWIPFKEYVALRKEWWDTVDTSASHTYKEEFEISKSMYNREMGYPEDGPVKRERFVFVKKILRHEGKVLEKQFNNTVSDFAGIMGMHIEAPKDKNDDDADEA